MSYISTAKKELETFKSEWDKRKGSGRFSHVKTMDCLINKLDYTLSKEGSTKFSIMMGFQSIKYLDNLIDCHNIGKKQ